MLATTLPHPFAANAAAEASRRRTRRAVNAALARARAAILALPAVAPPVIHEASPHPNTEIDVNSLTPGSEYTIEATIDNVFTQKVGTFQGRDTTALMAGNPPRPNVRLLFRDVKTWNELNGTFEPFLGLDGEPAVYALPLIQVEIFDYKFYTDFNYKNKSEQLRKPRLIGQEYTPGTGGLSIKEELQMKVLDPARAQRLLRARFPDLTQNELNQKFINEPYNNSVVEGVGIGPNEPEVAAFKKAKKAAINAMNFEKEFRPTFMPNNQRMAPVLSRAFNRRVREKMAGRVLSLHNQNVANQREGVSLAPRAPGGGRRGRSTRRKRSTRRN